MPSKEIMPTTTDNLSHQHIHLNSIHNPVTQQQQQQQQQQQIIHQNTDHIPQQQIQLQQQQEQRQQSKADFISVEELVHEIKENLRLKARPPSHQFGNRSRPSPYHIPCRSWNDQQQPQQLQQQSFIINSSSSNISICTECNNSNNTSSCNIIENNIECQTCKTKNLQLLQQQQNYNRSKNRFHNYTNQKKEQDIDDPYELLQKLLKSKNLVKEAVRRLQLNSISPKQRSYFYESDEESHSPMFRVCQLEL